MQKHSASLFAVQTARAVLFTCLIAMALSLVLSLVHYFALLPSQTVVTVCRVIKAVSIFFGCLLGLRDGRGLLKGATVGALGILATYLIIGLAIGGAEITPWIAVEVLFGAVVGAIGGVVAVNLSF